MSWEHMRTNWTQMRDSLRHRWGRLTEDDLDDIAGHRDIFIERVQERYALSHEEAQQRIEEWMHILQEQRVLTGRA